MSKSPESEPKTRVWSIVTSSLFLTAGIVLICLIYFMTDIPYQYFLVTLGICLIVVGIIGLIAVAKTNSKNQSNSTNERVSSLLCPDYYTRDTSNICVNSYTNSKFIYKIADAGNNVSLDLYLNKPLGDACTQLNLDNGSNLYPWTFLESRCKNM
jgi:hypothetical protein